MPPSRHKQVERMLGRLRLSEKQSSLTEIVERQRGKDDREPSELDGQPAKMTHIGVHGFAARQRQKGGAQHRKGNAGSGVTEVEHGVMRADGSENGRVVEDALNAEQGDRDEPHQHHRPKNATDELRSLALHKEQTDEDRNRDRK